MAYLPILLLAAMFVFAFTWIRPAREEHEATVAALRADPAGWLRSRVGPIDIEGEVYAAAVAGRIRRGLPGRPGSVKVAVTRDVLYAEGLKGLFAPAPTLVINRRQVSELFERNLTISDGTGAVSLTSVPREELPNALVRLGWIHPSQATVHFEPRSGRPAPAWFGRVFVILLMGGVLSFGFMPPLVGVAMIALALVLGLGWRFIGSTRP